MLVVAGLKTIVSWSGRRMLPTKASAYHSLIDKLILGPRRDASAAYE